jgi:uncharacterized Zn finger protein
MTKIKGIDGKDLGGDQATSPQFDLSKATDFECSNCSCRYFETVFAFKKMSALVSPTGQESMIPIQTFRCTECGFIEKEFLPKSF